LGSRTDVGFLYGAMRPTRGGKPRGFQSGRLLRLQVVVEPAGRSGDYASPDPGDSRNSHMYSPPLSPGTIQTLTVPVSSTRAKSAAPIGNGLDAWHQELAETLPIRKVVEAEDAAALAVHIMGQRGLTGGTYGVDVGQRYLCPTPVAVGACRVRGMTSDRIRRARCRLLVRRARQVAARAR
jgi:hypothetical protein